MKSLLPNHLEPRNSKPVIKKDFLHIPKKIFHTWHTNEVTLDLFNAAHTWIDKNPDWEYNFFTLENCREFIKNHFSNEILTAYDTLVPYAYKADLWRLCVLYIHGGVYADCKLVLINPLNQLLSYDTKFTATKDRVERKEKWDIFNTFLCATPQHPFLEEAISHVVSNVRNRYYGKSVLYPTGPTALGVSINKVLNRKRYHAFTTGFQQINKHEFTLWYFSDKFRFSNSPRIHTIYTDHTLNLPCFHTRYIGYEALRNDYKSNYSMAWRDCVIYKNNNDINNCLYPIIISIRDYYKTSNKDKARRLIWKQIKSLNMHISIIKYFVKYELIMFFSSTLSLFKK